MKKKISTNQAAKIFNYFNKKKGMVREKITNHVVYSAFSFRRSSFVAESSSLTIPFIRSNRHHIFAAELIEKQTYVVIQAVK